MQSHREGEPAQCPSNLITLTQLNSLHETLEVVYEGILIYIISKFIY